MGEVVALLLLALLCLDILGRVLAGFGGGIAEGPEMELSDFMFLAAASSILPPGGNATMGPLAGERVDAFIGRFPAKPAGFGFLAGLPLLLVSEVLELTELSLLLDLSLSPCSFEGVHARSRKSNKPDDVASESSFA